MIDSCGIVYSFFIIPRWNVIASWRGAEATITMPLDMQLICLTKNALCRKPPYTHNIIVINIDSIKLTVCIFSKNLTKMWINI